MFELSMSIKHNINFGLTGSVSVGKSTVLNALLWEYLGETKLKRTTYVPFKFINVNCKKHNVKTIKNEIIKINNDNHNEIKMKEFEMDFKWNKDNLYNCTIIDFPGLNDPHEVDNKMETILFNELVNLDYLIYVIDSNLSLNNKYERNFIEKLFENIKNCDTLTTLIILFNKYDEDDDEIDELIDETKKFINESSIKYEIIIPKMYKISGRKIMIKNVILKSQNQEVIPKNIREKVYKDYFGRSEYKKMMNYDFSKLEQIINNIPFTKDEYDFIYEFYDIFKDKSFYSKKLNDTQTKIDACISKNSNEKLEIYTNLFEKYLNLNILLNDCDKRNFIIKSMEYYINDNQFLVHETFQAYIDSYIKYLKSTILMKNHHRYIIIKSFDCYINKYKCTLDNCKIIYTTIYENDMFEESKKESYFFEYLKKMIDFYFEEEQLKIINTNMNQSGWCNNGIHNNIFEYIVNFKNDKYNLYFIEKIVTQQLFFDYVYNNQNHIDFLINNYDLIKANNKLDILFDSFMFNYFSRGCNINSYYYYMNNYISFNYVYKIYINRVNKIVEINLANKETLDELLIDLKTSFINDLNNSNNSQFVISYMKETHMYKILNVLNKKIDEKSDIFRNFDKKYASYYPIEIITLYNFYMHN